MAAKRKKAAKREYVCKGNSCYGSEYMTHDSRSPEFKSAKFGTGSMRAIKRQQ